MKRTDRDVKTVPQRTLHAKNGTLDGTSEARGQSRSNDEISLISRWLDLRTPIGEIRAVGALFAAVTKH